MNFKNDKCTANHRDEWPFLQIQRRDCLLPVNIHYYLLQFLIQFEIPH